MTKKILKITKYIKYNIADLKFIDRHRAMAKYFTRERVLTFPVVFLLILRKSVKSLQLCLNELFISGIINTTVTASAYTQARRNLKHSAFIELNDGVIERYYQGSNIKKWHNFRCLAIDGSKVILPNTEEIRQEFGSINIRTQITKEGDYTSSTFMCCYDVLNKIAINNILGPAKAYEVTLASEMLNNIKEGDLGIYDRGYASYQFFAQNVQAGKNYIIRCPHKSFKATESLFKQDSDRQWSKIVTVNVPYNQRKEASKQNLPLSIKVRFVSVILSTGEVEVLATSLMDQEISRDDFKHLYWLRWGVESFFCILKSRLSLENFTGKTSESVKQDFWSSILITNYETVLTEDTALSLNNNIEDKLPRQINKAVSFNALKHMAFDILFDSHVTDKENINKLQLLFRTNNNVIRTGRSPPRTSPTTHKLYNFARRKKKHVF